METVTGKGRIRGMKEIQIRQAVIEDLEQVAAVEARCFPAAEAADEKV